MDTLSEDGCKAVYYDDFDEDDEYDDYDNDDYYDRDDHVDYLQVDTLSEDGCTAVYYAVLGRHPQVIIIIIIISQYNVHHSPDLTEIRSYLQIN